MAITIDEIVNKAIPIPQEVLDECMCTGRLEAIKARRMEIKTLIMQWYEQETATTHTTEVPAAAGH